MIPEENERMLTEAFGIIADRHERLSVVVEQLTGAGLEAAERRSEDVVVGCVSAVWVSVGCVEGRLQVRWDADSPLVRGLVGLVCGVYEGTEPGRAALFSTTILKGLRLEGMLSPTRLAGLAAVSSRLQGRAAQWELTMEAGQRDVV